MATLVAAAACSSNTATTTTTTKPAASSTTTTAAPANHSPIIIGVALGDYSAFSKISSKYGVGPVQLEMASVLSAWQKAHEASIGGRPIEFVYHTFNILNEAAATALCTTFAQDDHVFAVLGTPYFTSGAECLASRFHIPVIDATSAQGSVFSQSGSDYFSIFPEADTYYAAFVKWAADHGYLKGKTIGVMYNSQETSESTDAGIAELTKLGYKVALKVDTGGFGNNVANIAIEKLQAAHVNLIIPFTGGSVLNQALAFAAQQHYTPQLLDLDTYFHTQDVTGETEAPFYSGTRALTDIRDGESAAGIAPPPQAKLCVSNYEHFTGRSFPKNPWSASGEYGFVLLDCDLGAVLLKGLQNAAAPLTAAGFVAGLEKISNLPASYGNVISFSATKHWGYDDVRPVQFETSCGCWIARGPWVGLSSL